MSVMLVVPSLHVGGAEKVTIELANGFAEQGHNVSLVILGGQGPLEPLVDAGVIKIFLGKKRAIYAIVALFACFRRMRPRAIISSLDYVNIVVALCVMVSGVRSTLIMIEHSTYSASADRRLSGSAWVFPWLIRFFYRKASYVVGVSQGVSDDIRRVACLSEAKVRTIYNPVISRQFFQAEGEPTHPWLSNADELPVLITVGRLTEAKDHENLLRAFQLVTRSTPARLIILGDGELREAMESLVERLGLTGSVVMPGFVKNPHAWLKKSRVFILSSKWEGLPSALIEAMASGTPVISTDCPSGPAEILEGGKWGRLVPVGNAEAMAKAILLELGAPKQGNGIARSQAFSRERSISEYAALISGSQAR